MFRILVVEDDRNSRKLIGEILSDAGYEPILCGNGAEALEAMDHRHVDLAVVDIMMPVMDGYEFTETVRKGGSDMPIIIVTAKETVSDKRRGFALGADDYLVKPFDGEELTMRIEALLRRSKIATERMLTVGSTRLDYSSLTVHTPDGTVTLPQKEFLLLFKLLSYPDKIFTRRGLMDEIWDLDTDTDERTVDVHVNRLRDKFRDSPDFRIVTVRGLGYEAKL